MKKYQAQFLAINRDGHDQWKRVPPAVGHSPRVARVLLDLVRDIRNGTKEVGVPYRCLQRTYFRLVEAELVVSPDPTFRVVSYGGPGAAESIKRAIAAARATRSLQARHEHTKRDAGGKVQVTSFAAVERI